MRNLKHKGGIFLGTLVLLYGTGGISCGGFIINHTVMQYVCYVLAAIGILLGLYFVASAKEIMGIPVIVTGLLHLGCALWTPHNVMPVFCIVVGGLSFINGFIMYSIVTEEKTA